MNFDKSYASNMENLFDNTGTGQISRGNSQPQSPKVVNDFENRPILSYTIPTNDCISPGLRNKPNFPVNLRQDNKHMELKLLSKSDVRVSEAGKTYESPLDQKRKLTRLSSARVVRTDYMTHEVDNFPGAYGSKTPIPSIGQNENKSRLARNNSFRTSEDHAEHDSRTNFVRTSNLRRSLQQGRMMPQTPSSDTKSSKISDQSRTSRLSAQVTKQDFLSRIFSIRNQTRSKSSQREENVKVNEEDELLTEQTLPPLTHDGLGDNRPEDVQSQGSDTSSGGSVRKLYFSGSTGTRAHGVDGFRKNFVFNSNIKGSNTQTIREGMVSSSSPSSSDNTSNNTSNNRDTAYLTPISRKILIMRSNSQSAPKTSNYSNDDVNNNYAQDDKRDKPILNRYGSMRVPKSSSSPYTKKRISFLSDQINEHSSGNDFKYGSKDNAAEQYGVFENLNSANWQSRRDGLACLQAIIDQSPQMLSEGDLKRVTDSFTKMFHDPHSKVCSLFLEVLPLFVSAYSVSIPRHWLNICSNKLFTKCGNELLGSIQVKIKKALEVIRESFNCDQHFEVMSSLVNNQSLMHNSKSRESFVTHVREFMSGVDPLDLCPSNDLNDLVTGLIALVDKYQSIEMKKNVQVILLTLFDLNPPTFSSVMHSQPRNMQDFMTRIARQHVNSTQNQVASPSSSSSSSHSFSSSNHRTSSQSRDCGGYVTETKHHHHRHHLRQQLDSTHSSTNSSDSAGPSMRNVSSPSSLQARSSLSAPDSPLTPVNFPSRIPQRIDPPTIEGLKHHQSNSSHGSLSSSNSSFHLSGSNSDVFGTPKIIKKVSLNKATIFGFFRRSVPSQHSDNDAQQFNNVLKHSKGVVQYSHGVQHSNSVAQHSNVVQHQHRRSSDCTDDEYLAAEFDVFVENFANNNIDDKIEWKKALKQLIHQLPTRPDLITDLHLTSLLSVLLSAPEDIDECSLIVAECLTTVLKTRRIDQSLLILKGILDQSNQSNVLQTLRWIKFQLDGVNASDIRPIIGDLVAGILKVSDADDKTVRTVSTMVLVQIYKLIGDDIWIHLSDINKHKKTFLQMYFRKPSKQ